MIEPNDKTKTMLKLIEEDAGSFAQRAEMYYKKRPELISMVEDFYRTHRSLAERYDQLKSDRVIRVKAPLRHSLSLPKEDYEYVLDSIDSFKPFDSLTDTAYTYEDAAESEVDDPEQENGDDKQYAANIIKQKDDEKVEIVNRLSYNIKELKEETIAARKENLGVVTKDTCEVIIPFDEVKNVKTEKKQVKKKESEVIEVMKKYEAEKTKSMYFEDELAQKGEENDTHVKKDEETKDMTRQVKHALTEEDETIWQLKEVLIRQLKEALIENNEGKREAMKQLKDVLAEKLDAIKQLKDALVQNDEERCEAIRQLKNALT
ncbi:Protein NETWORKED 3A [Bienertia sinuspersici]